MKTFFKILFLLIFMFFTFDGCKKDNTITISSDATIIQQLSDDDNNVQSSLDENLNDIEYLLTSSKSTNMVPCNATLDSVRIINDMKYYYITFDGLNCSGTKYRIGKVIVHEKVGEHWYDQGATIWVKHINFKVWRVTQPEKWIIINGEKTHINVTGGLLVQLGGSTNEITHRTTGEVNITFEDNSDRSWVIFRQKTFTGNFNDHTIEMKVDGFGSKDGYENLTEYGLTRKDKNFYVQTPQSIIFREVCDWDPCSGILKINVPSDSEFGTLTFGYKNYQPVQNGECPTQFKLDWIKGDKQVTLFINLK